jgi:hypothetical protein
LVRNETPHDPKSEASANAGRFIGMSDEVLRKIVRQSWTPVADINYERAFCGARSQMDSPLWVRRGASVDQQIEYDLPYALDCDGNRIVEVVDPIELNPLSRGLRLDEQSKIVDVNGAQRTLCSLSPVRDESWSNDVSNVGQAALEKVQCSFTRLWVAAVTAQCVDGIEKATEWIVDLMGHAGRKFAEHGIFLLIGKPGSQLFTFIQCARHRIEPIE